MSSSEKNNKMSKETTEELAAFLRSKDAHNPEKFGEFVKEHNLSLDAQTEGGYNLLQLAASRKNTEVFKYLVDNGADVNAKTTHDGSTESVLDFLEKLDQNGTGEIFGVLRESGKLSSDMEMYRSISTHKINEDDNVYSGGELAYASGNSIYIREADDETYKKAKDVYDNGEINHSRVSAGFLIGDSEITKHVLTHEYNHKRHYQDGIENEDLSAVEKLRLNSDSEAIAHTAQCMNAVLTYQELKENGKTTYEFLDVKGEPYSVPIETMLDMYSPKLREYIDNKKDFDINNPEHVDELAKVSLDSFWNNGQKERYSQEGGQFESIAKQASSDLDESDLYYEGKNSLKSTSTYDNTLDSMLKDVYVGHNKDVDLSGIKEDIQTMSGKEALGFVLQASGQDKSAEEIQTIVKLTDEASQDDFALMNKYLESKGEEKSVNSNEEYFATLNSQMSADKDFLKGYAEFVEKENGRPELIADIKAQVGEEQQLPKEMQARVDKVNSAVDEHEKAKEQTGNENTAQQPQNVKETAQNATEESKTTNTVSPDVIRAAMANQR